MSIPEDMIMGCLALLLDSEAGDIVHHMSVTLAPAGAIGPLGTPDEAKLETHMYAIAAASPDPKFDAEKFILESMIAARVNHHQRGDTILFAAMNQQMWFVDKEDFDQQARDLLKTGHLQDHPASVEVVTVYAVARDGRRWRGMKWLTGPKTGQTRDVDLLVGAPRAGETYGLTFGPVLRRLVGLPN